MSVIN